MPVSRTEIDRIRSRLCDGTPLPRPRLVPELSYGRHRGPARPQSRIAAVAVTLYHCPTQGWVIPLTLRPLNLQHHAGQICLPGGRVEAGETMFEAAFREFREELGVDAKVTTFCGQLSPQYVYASDNLVHPVVALIEHPGPWNPDPVEVAQVITLPLTQLKTMVPEPSSQNADGAFSRKVSKSLHAKCRGNQVIKQRGVMTDTGEVDQLRFRAPALIHQDHQIWGATALILDQLARVLHDVS
jgi:8-oxo-dGTP pyrophosphatase MutT (NUDIX family)